jgi:amino acid transporter
MTHPPRTLGVFLLAMLTFSFITGLGNAPALAETGLNAAFYLVLVAAAVLAPVALVSAELASGWPRAGGIYLWVSEAFGSRVGFVAMWFVWMSALVSFPALFSGLVAAVAFVVVPGLDDSTWFLGSIGLVVGWMATLFAFLGFRATAIITTVANVMAVFIPAVALIALGAVYLARGLPTQIAVTGEGLVPDFGSLATVSIAVSAYFTFAGGENAAQYVVSVRDPRRTFPRAMFLAAGMCLLVFLPVTIIIAATVPQHELSLAVGVLQVIKLLLDTLSVGWLVPVFAAMLTIGACTGLPNLLTASAAGMHAAARDGHMPARFARSNSRGVPVAMLVLQTALGSIVSMAFFTFQSVNVAFWTITVMGLQTTLVYYLMMYASALRLRRTQPDTPRPFRVPGGSIGIWIVAGGGFVLALGALGLFVIPPAQLGAVHPAVFDGLLVCVLVAAGVSGVAVSRRSSSGPPVRIARTGSPEVQ